VKLPHAWSTAKQTAELPNGVQRYPGSLGARVARALATGSA
jgi:hypothetical protein